MDDTQLFNEYLQIRNEIDQQCNELHSVHHAQTQCQKGCSACCMNFSILPVEFFSILSVIKENPPTLSNEDTATCVFLSDNFCQIYKERPSICRSHGLPILNMDEAGENMELSFCQLNFKTVEEDYFTLENGFQQDKFNSKLFLANQTFVANYKDKIYSDHELIEMRLIKDFL